ncbi:MAG TPA: response regulator transcription factor [Candidatus Krumholzibacteria bacterium]|nr:response regulator transcription factor [Candidatus Krumholzibacteria bacterium]HRX52277.1 response regulator transcription factor [Candidatus Krumholzibacteria bacterium]
MAKETILVVEDEPDILELIRFHLEREGYSTLLCETGEDGLEMARDRLPDLVLLDLMLPGLDGKAVCRKLKSDDATARIPVIMVTARGEESDIVAGLEIGADDYVTKPFSAKVLTARVGAVLRRVEKGGARTGTSDPDVITVHDLLIHPGRHEILADGEPVTVSSTEFGILRFLAAKPGWVFTRRQILRGVHGEDHPVLDRSIDVQIASLRKKLGDRGDLIETVRGVGYRFAE